MRIFGKILALFALVGLAACLFSCDKTSTFTHCEMLLTLPDDYEKTSGDEPFIIYDKNGFPRVFTTSNAASTDMIFSSEDALITLVRISKEAALEDGIPEFLTQLDFAGYYLSQSGIDAQIELHRDIPYYTYGLTSEEGEDFTILLTFYATPYAYFIISYITTADRAGEQLQSFLEIALDVGFRSID